MGSAAFGAELVPIAGDGTTTLRSSRSARGWTTFARPGFTADGLGFGSAFLLGGAFTFGFAVLRAGVVGRAAFPATLLAGLTVTFLVEVVRVPRAVEVLEVPPFLAGALEGRTGFVFTLAFAGPRPLLVPALEFLFPVVPRVFAETLAFFPFVAAAFFAPAGALELVLLIAEELRLADFLGLTAFFATVRFAGVRVPFGAGIRFLAMGGNWSGAKIGKCRPHAR